MLTDTHLRGLRPRDKLYKVADALGLYVTVTPTGAKSFRYDYRIDGRRETLTVGRYEEGTPNRHADDIDLLDFGATVSLPDARALRDRARRMVAAGISPSKTKVTKRAETANDRTFGSWASKYFAFKADPKSGDERLAESTLELRKSIYRRLLEEPIGKKNLDDIRAPVLAELFNRAKAERGPGPAVHARELVLLVYRYAIGQGFEVANPVENIQRKTIATFKARKRFLNRYEVKAFFDALMSTPMLPTLRYALKFMLLTAVRKSEFIDATWKEIDWERETWTIPAARMKADRPHTVYLSKQAIDILQNLQWSHPASRLLHPSRYDADSPISDATLNRCIDATVKRINENLTDGAEPFEAFCVHDLRRTFSTAMNSALFPEALIEASLAHSKRDQVAAAYNHAAHPAARRALMQAWADIVDCWIKGESARDVVTGAKGKIAEAAHDDAELEV